MSIPLTTGDPAAAVSPIFLPRLPDFRNQGIWLRLLLAANALMVCVALARANDLASWPREVSQLAALVEPALLLTLAILSAVAPRLQRLSVGAGGALVVGVAMVVMACSDALLGVVFQGAAGWRAPLSAGLASAGLLYWLQLRARARAPALAEARLMALTARIRPHFLFNSLNAVLGILREEPRRAEVVLEELAELFRALMQNNTELTQLSAELALARKYLDIERLRLGDRLRIRWQVDAALPETRVPPLLLQPLLENAVYHGIERAAAGGEIGIRIAAGRDGLQLDIDNPWHAADDRQPSHSGNHMALDNLRERLMLFYDLEARLDAEVVDGRYRVRLQLPLTLPP